MPTRSTASSPTCAAACAERIAIVVPPGCTWTLPAYELALMVAALADAREADAGHARARAVERLRRPGRRVGARGAAGGRRRAARGRAGDACRIPRACSSRPGPGSTCDRVVHLPLLAGPNCPGVPCDANGFVARRRRLPGARRRRCVRRRRRDGRAPTSRAGWPRSRPTSSPSRSPWQRRSRAPAAPLPSRPAGAPARPRTAPATCAPSRPGDATSAEVSDQCLWWPASKVAARWLTPWLAARDLEHRPSPTLRRLPSGGISSVTGR